MEHVGIRRFLENRMNNDFINSSVEHCTAFFMKTMIKTN